MTQTPHARLVPLIVADIFELAGRFRLDGEAIAVTAGQSQARWQVMSAASATPLTVPQIARRLGVTRQNVQRIADGLVAEGCARFDDNPDHRASPHVVLTRAGQDALAHITRTADGYHRRIARQDGVPDLQTLHRGLRRLIAALADVEPLSRNGEPR